MPATCPSPRRKAGAALRPKASPRVCGRSRGVFRNPDSVNSFGFIFLPFTIHPPRLGGAGTGKLRFAEIFGAAICAFDKLGANYRYLSVRRHALRRSLALAANKAPPLSPPNGGFLLS